MITSSTVYDAILSGQPLYYGHYYIDPILAGQFTKGSALPPILEAAFEPASSDRTKIFEELTLAVRGASLPGKSWNFPEAQSKTGNTVRGEDVKRAIIRAILTLDGATVFRDKPRSFTRQSRAPATLRLVGVRIEGDLDISNLNLPFSIRLTACEIQGAFIADRTRLKSLDLSGSVIRNGIAGNYLDIEGALRMRRTVSRAPVDLGGATIGATLDASDMIVVPDNNPSSTGAFVADRGMLNLSLSTVKKDLHLDRSRLYGGVNLRGGNIGGSLFLSDAIIRSPQATLEKIVYNAERYRKLENWSVMANIANTSDQRLASVVRIKSPPELKTTNADSLRLQIEQLEHVTPWPATEANDNSPPLLARLIKRGRLASGSAIRAAKIVISGNIIANGLSACGSCRWRYMTVGGRVEFKGIHLRSTQSIIQSLKVWEGRSKSENVCKNMNSQGISFIDDDLKQAYALDFEEARIGGSLALQRHHPHRPTSKLSKSEEEKFAIRRIVENLCATGEDPMKFYSVFVPRSGRHYSIIRGFRKDLRRSGKPFHNHRDFHDPKRSKEARLWQALWSASERFVNYRHHEFVHELENHPFVNKNGTSYRTGLESPLPQRPPAMKVSGRYPVNVVQEIAEACIEHGRLRSSLIEGEIQMRNMRLGSDFLLSGAIFNAFNETALHQLPNLRKHKECLERPHTNKKVAELLLRNATIGGDVYLRHSLGIARVSAAGVTIGGSWKSCERPKFNPDTDLYRPLRYRAMLLFEPKKDSSPPTLGKYDFSGASIEGDATFLFDRSFGPELKLTSIRIGGILEIIPAFGNIEATVEDRENVFEEADHARRNNPIRLLWLLDAFQVSAEKLNRQLISAKKLAGEMPPLIDLRGASAEVIDHPVAAWPKQDGLLIEGFRYERSKQLGPLPPPRRTWSDIHRNRLANRLPILVSVFFGILLVIVSAWAIVTLYRWFGIWNTASATLLTAGFIAIRILRHTTDPPANDVAPLAVPWLLLQRRRFNTRRLRHAVRPLEPYIKAAAVLRSAGRNTAAKDVEFERLKLRRRSLSKRSALPLFLLLKATELAMKYGFAPVRIVFIFLMVILTGASAFHFASEHLHIIQASDEKRIVLALEQESDPKLSEEIRIDGILPAEQRRYLEGYPVFNSFWFSVDAAIPFMSLQQNEYWSVARSPEEKPISWQRAIRILFIILQVSGWIITTMIAISLGSRIETIVARSEEL